MARGAEAAPREDGAARREARSVGRARARPRERARGDSRAVGGGNARARAREGSDGARRDRPRSGARGAARRRIKRREGGARRRQRARRGDARDIQGARGREPRGCSEPRAIRVVRRGRLDDARGRRAGGDHRIASRGARGERAADEQRGGGSVRVDATAARIRGGFVRGAVGARDVTRGVGAATRGRREEGEGARRRERRRRGVRAGRRAGRRDGHAARGRRRRRRRSGERRGARPPRTRWTRRRTRRRRWRRARTRGGRSWSSRAARRATFTTSDDTTKVGDRFYRIFIRTRRDSPTRRARPSLPPPARAAITLASRAQTSASCSGCCARTRPRCRRRCTPRRRSP